MRPRHKAAEILLDGEPRTAPGEASMRPRHKAAEIPRPGRKRRLPSICFNEAAA